MKGHRPLCALVLALFLGSCAGDRTHVVHVSVPAQRMTVLRKGEVLASYPVSTSKFGLGDTPGSNRTPLGMMAVAQKIGAGAPSGMKFKDRKPTGEVVPVNAPGRDPIVTRILWLKGLETQNANAFERMIYIHGTPEEARLGSPASYGCIRMRSRDVIELFDTVGRGARVIVSATPPPFADASAVLRSPSVPKNQQNPLNAGGSERISQTPVKP